MQQAGLTFNEPCQILDEYGKVIGCGIAWRAADKMGASPKMRPARMSETLRGAFGIKEGSHVSLQRSSVKTLHAEKLSLTDVTPNERSTGQEDEMDSRRWRTRCAAALCMSHTPHNLAASQILIKVQATQKPSPVESHLTSLPRKASRSDS